MLVFFFPYYPLQNDDEVSPFCNLVWSPGSFGEYRLGQCALRCVYVWMYACVYVYIYMCVCVWVGGSINLFSLPQQPTDAQSFTCSVGSGGACPVAFCPGDEVTYTCDVGTVMGATEWKLPNGTCGDSVISLSQFGTCATDDDTCGPFSAVNDGSDGTNCLVSSLTVTASTDLNNTLIRCKNVGLSNSVTQVDSAILTIIGLYHMKHEQNDF